MAKPSNGPSSLSEAIDRLENAGQSKAKDFKEILEKDYEKVRSALDDLKPFLNDLRDNVEAEVKKTKNEVENKVKENPWVALGIVGIFAFVIGWLLGSKKD